MKLWALVKRVVASCVRRVGSPVALIWVVFAIFSGGCSSSPGPYAPQSEAARDSKRAQRLTQDAAAILHKDPARAERLLRDALTADLYHGPAHNDLGVLFLNRDQLYEASGEFEWARKLMPGHPDPTLNLALTLERAGRSDQALAMYASALEVYPDYIRRCRPWPGFRSGPDAPTIGRGRLWMRSRSAVRPLSGGSGPGRFWQPVCPSRCVAIRLWLSVSERWVISPKLTYLLPDPLTFVLQRSPSHTRSGFLLVL
jgi:tetratricopeptide (TPR) repeat protein